MKQSVNPAEQLVIHSFLSRQRMPPRSKSCSYAPIPLCPLCPRQELREGDTRGKVPGLHCTHPTQRPLQDIPCPKHLPWERVARSECGSGPYPGTSPSCVRGHFPPAFPVQQGALPSASSTLMPSRASRAPGCSQSLRPGTEALTGRGFQLGSVSCRRTRSVCR